MKLLVIIVTYNAMQWAERCFNSLQNSSIVPDVFVVDNGSTDGTQAYIQEHYPEVLFQQSKENLGFGKANNLGLQYALDKNYDYVYLLNQDAWVMRDTFEKLIKLSKGNPVYGILSPFQMNADMYHIDQSFVANVLTSRSNKDICSDMFNQKYKDIYPALNVMAAHWFMTRECILKVGGFSPTFSHYSEDYNYLDRVYYWGMKVGIVPSLKVVHDRGERKDSIKKLLYLRFTGYMQTLSNPNVGFLKSFVDICFGTIKNTIIFKSVLPIRYWGKILINLRTLLNNRKISMIKSCAFLSLGS